MANNHSTLLCVGPIGSHGKFSLGLHVGCRMGLRVKPISGWELPKVAGVNRESTRTQQNFTFELW